MKSGRYRLYLTHLKGSRRLLLLAIIFGLVYGLAQSVGLPVLIGKILPTVFGSPAERAAPVVVFPDWLGGGAWHLPRGHEVAFAVAFLPAVFLVRGVSQFLASYFVNLAGLRVVDSVRSAVFAKLQRLHLGFFGKLPTGDLMQRLTGDVQSVRMVLVDISTDAIIQPFTLLGAVGFVVYRCLTIPGGGRFLLCLLVVPVSVFLARAIGQALHRRATLALGSAADLNGIVVENLQSPREIRAYGLQAREERRFGVASREGLRHAVEAMLELNKREPETPAALTTAPAMVSIPDRLIDHAAIEQMQQQFPPDDWQMLMNSAVGEMLDSFEAIARALALQDTATIQSHSHRVKGLARTFAAPRLATTAELLETHAAKPIPHSSLNSGVEDLRSCLNRTVCELRILSAA